VVAGVVSAAEIERRVKLAGLSESGKPDRRRRQHRIVQRTPTKIDPIIEMLVEARVAIGWSQRDLARAIASAFPSEDSTIAQAVLAKYERGHRSPSLARLRTWAQVLDVEIVSWPIMELDAEPEPELDAADDEVNTGSGVHSHIDLI